MLQEYNYEFTVAEAKPFANITAVKSSDGTKITYLEDLNETENLQVDVSYMFPEAKDKIECIAAYYKDDMLLQCDPIDVDTKSDYTKTATFTLPGEDVLGQATSVKILLWDSLTNMVPYDKAYVIEPAPEPDPSESPSASASAIPAD